jgi:hypothetical protein
VIGPIPKLIVQVGEVGLPAAGMRVEVWTSLPEPAVGVSVTPGTVRAENRIHGSDQQSCSPGAPLVIITGHDPAVRVPPYNATSRVAAAVPA